MIRKYIRTFYFFGITLNHDCNVYMDPMGGGGDEKSPKEPPHYKTNKMACAPSEDSDQPGHPPSLIRVFADRMKKALVLSYPLSAQRRLIRLGGSESSLGVLSFLLVLSWGGSNMATGSGKFYAVLQAFQCSFSCVLECVFYSFSHWPIVQWNAYYVTDSSCLPKKVEEEDMGF